MIQKPVGSHVDKVRHSKLKFDPNLQNGPVANRSCTNILCCLIFSAFLILYVVIFFMGVTQGKPWLLVTPFDSDGNGCGYTTGFENHKFIYFYKVSIRAYFQFRIDKF